MPKTKQTQKTSTRRQPPIVVVPDKSYIDDTGSVIPTDVILIADLEMYERMQALLGAWDKEQIREQEFRVGEGI